MLACDPQATALETTIGTRGLPKSSYPTLIENRLLTSDNSLALSPLSEYAQFVFGNC